MNNVVSDLATYILGGRLVVVDGRYGFGWSSGLFAFVSNLSATLENLSSIFPGAHRLLSLRFVDCSKIKISDGAFSSAKKLRLLDLRGCLDKDFLDNAYWPDSGTPPPTKQPLKRCSMGKLPESIGQLKRLRYLNAPAIQDRVLPLSIINGLSRSLRYLSLRGSRQLSELTEAFGSMEYLEYLDLSGCSGLKSLPKSFGACWRSLLHLDLSGCTGLKALPQSVRKVSSNSSKLRHLDLSGCSCLEGATEALSGCTDLRYLNLSHRCGYSVEDWFHLKGLDDVLPTLKELQFLGISSCLDPFCYAMPAEESSKYVNCISMLDKLEHLDLSQNKFLRHLPEKIGALKELRTLDLSMCFRLESLQGIGEVNELRALDISGCPQLNPLPEDTQQQLAKLPFLESREWLTSITGPSQASGSQDWASTSQDAARQTRMYPSSSEPEITEIPENH